MDVSGGVLAVAAAAFVATDIDDLALLMLFFLAAGRGESPRYREIVAGQYVGFVALLAVASAGAAGLAAVPHAWVRWIGLVPVALGLRALLRRRSEPVRLRPGAGLVGVTALTIGCGADNVSVYVPLLHDLRLQDRLVFCAVQLVLLAVWCAVGAAGARFVAAGSRLQRVRWLTPATYIVVGGAVVLGVSVPA